MEKTSKRTITNFLNTEYLNYAFSVLEERAIPSAIDGFKPGARKIMHASLAGTTKDGKLYKLLALSGDAMRVSLYAHGDSSLNGTIVNMCKSFNDNLNPLESDSQVGSLRDPDSAGAPRYLYVKHSKYMDLIYKTDYDLLDFVFEEGQYVEPMTYLPIIPTVLCKNNIGVAVGYSMHNQAYNPIDVIDACKEVLNARADKKEKITTTIYPYIRGIKKSNWRYEDDSWVNYGEWKLNQSKDLMVVTDLPADVSYEDFEKLLNKFEDEDYIKGWKNKSVDGGVNYEITFPKKQLAIEMKRDRSGKRIANKFKLIKQLPDDLFWLLDENHKLKNFKSKNEIIEYFVNYRLGIYTERKKKLVKILEQRYKDNSDLVKFIELVCKGKLKIRNRSKKDIKVDMDGYKLPIGLISTSMSKCTIEERDELLRQNEEIKKELDYIRNTTEKQMYINDLNNLRKEIEKDFR
jgi:DNA topoisomerase-2